MVNQLLEVFMKKNSKKQIKKNSKKKNLIKRKGNKLYVKWKRYEINSFNSWIDEKKACLKMSQYFPKTFRNFGGNVNVKVDLSNYATKT